MTGCAFSMKGWRRFWRKRKRELGEAGAGYYFGATPSQIAFEECRCRAGIAEIIGKNSAMELDLMLVSHGRYEPASFVIMSPMRGDIWERLADVDGLLFPPELHRNS